MKTEKQIREHLEENGFNPDSIFVNSMGIVEVEINWGDWKHDHIFCDRLMNGIGYVKVDEDITEDDGSDTYSSIHFFEVIK